MRECQKRANNKYRKEKCKQLNVVFFPKDKELFEYLETKPSKAEYIRELVRADFISSHKLPHDYMS